MKVRTFLDFYMWYISSVKLQQIQSVSKKGALGHSFLLDYYKQREVFVTMAARSRDKSTAVRLDHAGPHRAAYEKNRKKILATASVCGICGKPVDTSLKYPHPLSPTVDHIVPVNRGGHPSDINNLQLAHFTCNRQKSDKLVEQRASLSDKAEVLSNRVLPQSMDWKHYRA